MKASLTSVFLESFNLQLEALPTIMIIIIILFVVEQGFKFRCRAQTEVMVSMDARISISCNTEDKHLNPVDRRGCIDIWLGQDGKYWSGLDSG